jgi:NAD(P)-dependent dehydrogenase (short-subunit alcohol dehydrogenase family)
MPVALITGGSAGLGLALATALAGRDDWDLLLDARGRPALDAAARLGPRVVTVPGDVTDEAHRAELLEHAKGFGRIDLLVNNAGALGPSPLPRLSEYPLPELESVLRTNVIAPLALIQLALPLLTRTGGTIVNITSDAAVEPYPGWGGYGASKAALDQAGAVLAAELEGTGVRVYGFDPGDLRTAMHQNAFPGEDISDRPEPATAVPALLHLVESTPRAPSGRYRAADLTAGAR